MIDHEKRYIFEEERDGIINDINNLKKRIQKGREEKKRHDPSNNALVLYNNFVMECESLLSWAIFMLEGHELVQAREHIELAKKSYLQYFTQQGSEIYHSNTKERK